MPLNILFQETATVWWHKNEITGLYSSSVLRFSRYLFCSSSVNGKSQRSETISTHLRCRNITPGHWPVEVDGLLKPNHLESASFRTKLEWVCVYWRECVILSQSVIVALWQTPALPSSPGDSGPFRWAYLSTHKGLHSQAAVCGEEPTVCFSPGSQSVLRCFHWQTHTVVAFVYHSNHSRPNTHTETWRQKERYLNSGFL